MKKKWEVGLTMQLFIKHKRSIPSLEADAKNVLVVFKIAYRELLFEDFWLKQRYRG